MNKKPNILNNLEPLYSRAVLAEYLGVSIPTVKRMLAQNEIRHVKYGHHIWIPQSAVEEWLQRQKPAATYTEAQSSALSQKKGNTK